VQISVDTDMPLNPTHMGFYLYEVGSPRYVHICSAVLVSAWYTSETQPVVGLLIAFCCFHITNISLSWETEESRRESYVVSREAVLFVEDCV
jgi:hypothetical protein